MQGKYLIFNESEATLGNYMKYVTVGLFVCPWFELRAWKEDLFGKNID